MYTRICPVCSRVTEHVSKYAMRRGESESKPCGDCRYRQLGDRNRIAVERAEVIIQMFLDGAGYRQIRSTTGAQYNTVKGVLVDAGVFVQKKRRIKMVIENGMAVCSTCGVKKHTEEFKRTRAGSVVCDCNQCRREYEVRRVSGSIRALMVNRVNQLRKKCRERGLVCEVTPDGLVALYHAQNGLCFYTDVLMNTNKGVGLTRHHLTVDRVIPERGYIMSNVVLCAHVANNVKCDLSLDEMREWLPGWYERLQKGGLTEC